ncbi:MAG TPA: peptidase [Bacillus bacterium]|uniref:Cell wall elongation regulator TseB-like domain-containing protein n=1 Tax=Siminovitchia fordii TaxID=254759 RepID=A0ABQ4K7A2_9BACI|nr:DUF5590 domain-containing protein [Siminovitchia fordii]GIN21077.1 hypothetical protein J1TS3_22110 [Siminovitchia fordii]HBZ09456.1 peptidase [Bacillus sp. (in: firmicutes)]
MYKWLAVILACILIAAGITGCVYSKAMTPVKKARDAAEARLKSETDIKSVDEFYLYNGSSTYFVVIGKNSKGKETAAWIPENKKDEVHVKKMSDGVSKQDAVNKLLSEKKPKEILGVRLGMEKELPVWELSYLDENSNLNYYYIHFDSGKWWRKIENL